MSRARKIISTIDEAMVKGDKLNLDKLKKEMYTTAYHFIEGLNNKKVPFEYDADKGQGKIKMKNLNDIEFNTSGEGIYFGGPLREFSIKGALSSLTVVQKIIELDNFISKAR